MSTLRNTVANYIGQGWVALMGIVFLPVFITHLGLEAFGLIGFYVMLSAFLPLIDLGLTPMLAREMARYHGKLYTPESIRDLLRSVEIVTTGLAVILIGCGIIFSGWLAKDWLQVETLPIDDVVTAIKLMILILGLRLLEGIYRSVLIGLERQVAFNIVNSFMVSIRWIGSVSVVIWIESSVLAFFIWQSISSVLSLLVLASITYKHLPHSMRSARFSLSILRPVWMFSRGMLIITFLALILTQVDKLIISRLLSLGEFASYSLAATVAAALFMLAVPVTQAWYPRLCQASTQENPTQEALIYHSGALLISIIVGSTAVLLITHSYEILMTWTSNHELSSQVWPVLSLLALGNLLNATMHMPYHAQLAHGWTSLTVRTNIIAVLVIIPSVLLGITYFGVIGAAIAWVFLNLGYILFVIPQMHKRILKTEMREWYLNEVLVPFLGACLGAAVATSVIPFPAEKLMQIISLGATFLLILLSTLFSAKRTRYQILNVLRKRLA